MPPPGSFREDPPHIGNAVFGGLQPVRVTPRQFFAETGNLLFHSFDLLFAEGGKILFRRVGGAELFFGTFFAPFLPDAFFTADMEIAFQLREEELPFFIVVLFQCVRSHEPAEADFQLFGQFLGGELPKLRFSQKIVDGFGGFMAFPIPQKTVKTAGGIVHAGGTRFAVVAAIALFFGNGGNKSFLSSEADPPCQIENVLLILVFQHGGL